MAPRSFQLRGEPIIVLTDDTESIKLFVKLALSAGRGSDPEIRAELRARRYLAWKELSGNALESGGRTAAHNESEHAKQAAAMGEGREPDPRRSRAQQRAGRGRNGDPSGERRCRSLV